MSVLKIKSSRAGVVQWQYRSFPSFGRGFDSHRPLQKTKHLDRCLIFHFFQISANPCFFFTKYPSCFSGQISYTLQTNDLSQFFEYTSHAPRLDQHTARLQIYDSTSHTTCPAPLALP